MRSNENRQGLRSPIAQISGCSFSPSGSRRSSLPSGFVGSWARLPGSPAAPPSPRPSHSLPSGPSTMSPPLWLENGWSTASSWPAGRHVRLPRRASCTRRRVCRPGGSCSWRRASCRRSRTRRRGVRARCRSSCPGSGRAPAGRPACPCRRRRCAACGWCRPARPRRGRRCRDGRPARSGRSPRPPGSPSRAPPRDRRCPVRSSRCRRSPTSWWTAVVDVVLLMAGVLSSSDPQAAPTSRRAAASAATRTARGRLTARGWGG